MLVSYYMNKLQGLKAKQDFFVTLGAEGRIASSKIIKEIDYYHPVFDSVAVDSQKELESLNGVDRLYFCGSYFRNGFHEDAVWSANEVGKHFGSELKPGLVAQIV